jgi:hypothetical protein
MNKLLLIAVISSVLVMGMLVDNTIAQTPPDLKERLKVSLALADSLPDVPNRLVYLTVDPIRIVLTLKYDGLQEIITSKGFAARKFYLFLSFIDPDGKGIIAKKLEDAEAGDPPPPQVIPFGDGVLLQVEPVEILPVNWAPLPYVLPNAHAYYRLTKPGNYSVKAIIHMGTFPEVFYTDPVTGEKYAKIENPLNWAGDLQSNTVHFTLLADADEDTYYYPEGYPSGTLADCDDNNRNRNPGIAETPCNGVDDDCNSATPDFPAPTLASPTNGATNVSTTPTLSWSGISCATSYGVQVSTSSSFLTTVVNETGIQSTSYPVSGLDNNTTYYWRVNATKPGEESAWSPPRSFTTTTIKTHLLIVTKIGIGSGNVTASPGTLIWNGIIGTATYNHNTTVTLTATPSTDSTFNGWYAFCLGTEGCSVTINGSNCTLKMCGPCFANATFMLKTYTITATAGTGGSITPSGSVKVNYGANKTFKITPNAGYQIKDVKVDNVSKGAISTYTFTNVTTNHTISATFKIKTYTITATAGTGGKISPSGSVTVNHGADKTFTITPNTRYKIKDVKVDNVSKGAISTYTFTNVTANHTISAIFINKR